MIHPSIEDPADTATDFDLRVESYFKNGLLFRCLDQVLGPGWTQSRAAKYCGVSPTEFGLLLRLKVAPKVHLSRRYKKARLLWRKSVLRIAEKLAYSPGELFPESLYVLGLPEKIVREYKSPEVLELREAYCLADPGSTPLDLAEQVETRGRIEAVLEDLSPKERLVLSMRYGLGGHTASTPEEVATCLHVSRGRVGQIGAKALRKLRHPSRANTLLGIPALANPRPPLPVGPTNAEGLQHTHPWAVYVGDHIRNWFSSLQLACDTACEHHRSTGLPCSVFDLKRGRMLTKEELMREL